MQASAGIKILIADEDALRREGLASILACNENFEIIARVADGESALDQIRNRQPDVAIVDLHLPKMHGIELIRRLRTGALGTKVVIHNGTADDEIIAEVARVGGDGYLLKNWPAFHLVDAISYVRGGGQYFFPQLRRNGHDREMPERELPEVDSASPAGDRSRAERLPEYGENNGRTGNARRPRERIGGLVPLRERLHEAAELSDPDDRKYEMATKMAGRTQPEDGLGDELEARLPGLIEETVTLHFHRMADKLQREIEKTHVRTLETFVGNIQVKLVQRVATLEHDMTKQAEMMHQSREYSQRMEDHLMHLMTGVDRLARELPKRLPAPVAEAGISDFNEEISGETEAPRLAPDRPRPQKRKASSGNRGVKLLWATIAGLAVRGFLARGGAGGGARLRKRGSSLSRAPAPASLEVDRPASASARTDTRIRLQEGQEYLDRSDYAMVEEVYRQVVRNEPANAEDLKALASVLYREDKIEESAMILERIPK